MKDVSQVLKNKFQKEFLSERSAFPKDVHSELEKLSQWLFVKPLYDYEECSYGSQDKIEIIVSSEKYFIPSRLNYHDIEDDVWWNLSDKQQGLLACLYTRSLNGYVREKYVVHLFGKNEPWVIPFVLLLLGEYVIEIADSILKNLNSLDKSKYQAFAKENPAFMKSLHSRIISYWNCYYRWSGQKSSKTLKGYSPCKVLVELGLWDHKAAPNLS